MKYETLGEHLRLADTRNVDMTVDRLLGISIDKYFMPSVANIIGTDLSNYKCIIKGQFACNPMHIGRDERLPIALYTEEEPAIVSPAYFLFQIIDERVLLPEYLMMWFRRAEFDRICWLKSDGSVRGGVTWDDFCEITLPLPSLEKQKSVVKSYQFITNRILLKRRINDNLEATIETIYVALFIENTAKEAWKKGTAFDVLTLQRGHDLPKTLMKEGQYPVIGSTGVIGYHNQFTTNAPLIALGRSGNIGKPQYYQTDCWAHNTCLYVKEFRSVPLWAFYMLKHINYDSFTGGSAVPTLNRNFVHAQEIIIPPSEIQDDFARKITSFIDTINYNRQEIDKLHTMQGILFSRMAISL
ncbi:hypothetical protein AGMMS50212_00130 [Spirochaetia bacterium]|nr:hypothetical protein AGMMS50212_00130 [Spirochaetia bacterium]